MRASRSRGCCLQARPIQRARWSTARRLAEIVDVLRKTRRAADLRRDLSRAQLCRGATYQRARDLPMTPIVVNSFSKYYCMTGWRIGWLVLPETLIRRAEMMAQSLFISASSVSPDARRWRRSTSVTTTMSSETIMPTTGWRWLMGLQQLGFRGRCAVRRRVLRLCRCVAGLPTTRWNSASRCWSRPGWRRPRASISTGWTGSHYVRFSYAGVARDDRQGARADGRVSG